MTTDLSKLISELKTFELNVNRYYSDTEYENLIDNKLQGKIKSLHLHLIQMGLDNLAQTIDEIEFSSGQAISILETLRGYVLGEIENQLQEPKSSTRNDWWSLIHPKVRALAQERFDAGFYADAVESALKEVNKQVKVYVHRKTNQDLDGSSLMTTAFSVNKPIISLSTLANESEKNIQQGYMQIFAGAMTGIRNPKAHDNLVLEKSRAIHLIFLSSLLMYKLQDAGVISENENTLAVREQPRPSIPSDESAD